MNTIQTDREQLLLKAAEEEFLEKGFGKARTTEIAKRAGVTHAMLHYYFKTKENLFKMVFARSAEIMANIMLFALQRDLPFLDRVRRGVEQHFDFIAANPHLTNFIFSEIRSDDRLLAIVTDMMKVKTIPFLIQLDIDIREEVAKGNIKFVESYDILLNVMSLNTTIFSGLPIFSVVVNFGERDLLEILAERKEKNVDMILSMFKL